MNKCTQTAVWSDLHYLYSSGIFTHCFLFPVYIFKVPNRDPYFLSENLSFCMYCRQSGVLAVHLLYTSDYYCDFLLLSSLIHMHAKDYSRYNSYPGIPLLCPLVQNEYCHLTASTWERFQRET